jgi:hypothetical protein
LGLSVEFVGAPTPKPAEWLRAKTNLTLVEWGTAERSGLGLPLFCPSGKIERELSRTELIWRGQFAGMGCTKLPISEAVSS